MTTTEIGELVASFPAASAAVTSMVTVVMVGKVPGGWTRLPVQSVPESESVNPPRNRR